MSKEAGTGAIESVGTTDGLTVNTLDAVDQLDGEVVYSLARNQHFRGMYLRQENAYLWNQDSQTSELFFDGRGIGLRVYNVSDQTAPQEVAYHLTPGIYVTGIALANGLIYLADDSHFEILEVTQGPSGVEDTQPATVVSDYKIHSVYPNPFNATTKIVFDVAKAGHVTLQVYNIAGQKVQTLADGYYDAGRHTRVFQAGRLVSGIYFVHLDSNGIRDMRKAVLVR